jgi:putative phosphoesterase
MILGVLSDSHGYADRTAHALTVLEAAGATAFVHCGDVGDSDVLEHLASRQAWFVWGNTDSPGPTMHRYLGSIGVPVPETLPLDIALAGRRIRVCHGHERVFGQLLDLHLYEEQIPEAWGGDFLLHGHTHAARFERLPSGACLLNPGALHRAAVYSVATLDLEQGEALFWVVDEHKPASSLVSFKP